MWAGTKRIISHLLFELLLLVFSIRVQHVTKWWIFLSSKFPWHANNASEQPVSVVYWFMWFILQSIRRSLPTEVSQQQKCNEPVNWNYLRFSFPHRKAHSSQARLELRNVHFPIFINIQLLKQLSETFRAVLLQTMRLGEHEFPYKLIHDELRYLYCIFFPHEIQRLQGNCGRTTDVAWHWRKQTLPKRLAPLCQTIVVILLLPLSLDTQQCIINM